MLLNYRNAINNIQGLPTTGNSTGDMLYWNGSAWVKITPGNSGQTLVLQSSIPTWVNSVPGAPTSVSAVAGNAQATVSFTPPLNNGGSSITGYTVASSPGYVTSSGSGSPITLSGLTNGTTYSFTVVATNAAGNSSTSVASSAVTLALTAPGAPTNVTAVIGNTQATVSFTAPSNGGSAITGYTVTSSPSGGTGTGAGSPITVTGLTNGTSYTFTVVATNVVGSSSASSASSAVIPATVPGAPTSVTAVEGNTQATVSFTAPSSTGGSSITGYTVTSSPSGGTGTGAGSPITVTGLTNGTSYTFSVVATNVVGSSSASSASNAVTPFLSACSSNSVSDRDGNSYTAVSIGTQCWMASNLRVTTYNNGDSIPLDVSGGSGGSTGQNWTSRTTGARTVYAHDNNNFTTYGYLYNWFAAADSRGICPAGWHVPTDSEWTTLTNFLGGASVAGGVMKSTGTSLWNSPNDGATNSSSFSGLPGGLRQSLGSFSLIKGMTAIWSSDAQDSLNGWTRQLGSSGAQVTIASMSKVWGGSIRCIKD